MPSASFELRLTMPADARLGDMVRDLVAYGARQLGRSEPDAAAFGRRVEDALLASLGAGGPRGENVSIAVNDSAGLLEVVVSHERVGEAVIIRERQ